MQAALKKSSFSLASLRECQSRCSTCQKLQWRWSLASIRCRTVPSTPSLCLSAMHEIDRFLFGWYFWEGQGINSNWKIWRSVLGKLHITFHELSESIERCWWMGELSPERDEIALKGWLKPSSSSYSSLEFVFSHPCAADFTLVAMLTSRCTNRDSENMQKTWPSGRSENLLQSSKHSLKICHLPIMCAVHMHPKNKKNVYQENEKLWILKNPPLYL